VHIRGNKAKAELLRELDLVFQLRRSLAEHAL